MGSESLWSAGKVLSLIGSVGAMAAILVYFFVNDDWDGWLVISGVAIVIAAVSGGLALALAAKCGYPRRSAAALLGLALVLVAIAIAGVILFLRYVSFE